MKRWLVLIIVLSCLALCLGCLKKNENITKKVEVKEAETLKGEWKVVGVNCLDILAEKDGKRKIFRYLPPAGFGWISLTEQVLYCRKTVKPGWVIQVESEDKYSFFPANTENTIDPNKKSSKATKR